MAAHATVFWHRAAQYYRDRPWRGTWIGVGGGLLMNQAIHTLDLLQWLVGDVESVAGSVSTRSLADVIEVEDTAEITLNHASGVRSLFYATLANGVNSPVTIDIVTERATLQLRGDLTITHANGSVETVAELPARLGSVRTGGSRTKCSSVTSMTISVTVHHSGLTHERRLSRCASSRMSMLSLS
ncbi:MAG TPA: Gfo/Idh/MocA family oxidoreductase [Dermatophilaceae bacterium]|nr:Gfo/Idh/MocA family oxidoreductase [Dermatophilaceae bacterium]